MGIRYKRTLIAVSALAMASCLRAAAQTPADSADVGLDDCLRIALSESPTLRVADLDIVRVDYRRKETLSQLLPQVSFGGQYSRMLAKQVAYMNMSGFPGMGGGSTGDGTTGDGSDNTGSDAAKETSKSRKDTGIKMGLDNSFQVGFNASVPIIAPQIWQALKLSDAQIATTVEQARASRLNLINSVKSAYYAYLLARESRQVIGESYDMAALTHDIYVKQHAVGSASEYDVLRTSVAMKNIEPQITQADIAVSRARMQLFMLMGVSIESPLRINGSLSEYEKTMYDDVMRLGSDYSNNSQLRLNTLQTEALRRSVKMNRMSWWPTLSLSASYNWTSSSDGSPFKNFRWNPYSVVGLSLNFPLFQGGARSARIRQAQIQVKQAEFQRQDLENSVAMQVELAKDNVMLNVKQIASSGESVGQAERAHSIMQQSFEIGAASYLDLRDSELALTNSRLSYIQSIYNYLVAGAELELLLGNAVVPGEENSTVSFSPAFKTLFTGETSVETPDTQNK